MTLSHGKRKGSLTVICGPMFSGKSEELIRLLRRAKIAKQNVITFKHALDNQRASDTDIISHNGNAIYAVATDSIAKIRTQSLKPDIDVVGIDEVQFFSNDIVATIATIVDAHKQVLVAGLDLDFRGVPFGAMGTLLAIADTIIKLHAICTECGDDAHFTQRFINNFPAKYNDPIIHIGAQDAYQARCRSCYLIDHKAMLI